MRTLCVTPAGIHIPRCGGMTQAADPVLTVDDPGRTVEQLMAKMAVRTDGVAVRIIGAARHDRPADLGEKLSRPAAPACPSLVRYVGPDAVAGHPPEV